MRSKFLLALVAGGTALLGLTGTAHAQQWDSCSARIQKDQQDFNRAVYSYGYYSKQAQHERDELQRDAADCDRTYRDRDDWRYRDDGGYYDNYDAAWHSGYRDGLLIGERDAQKYRTYRPSKNDWYEDADRGYNRAYGDKSLYKFRYRQGFEQGYSEGYRR